MKRYLQIIQRSFLSKLFENMYFQLEIYLKQIFRTWIIYIIQLDQKECFRVLGGGNDSRSG